jgi:hypothetical protein
MCVAWFLSPAPPSQFVREYLFTFAKNSFVIFLSFLVSHIIGLNWLLSATQNFVIDIFIWLWHVCSLILPFPLPYLASRSWVFIAFANNSFVIFLNFNETVLVCCLSFSFFFCLFYFVDFWQICLGRSCLDHVSSVDNKCWWLCLLTWFSLFCVMPKLTAHGDGGSD